MNSFSAAEELPQEKWLDCLANLLYVYFPDLVGLALEIQQQPGGMSGNRSNGFSPPPTPLILYCCGYKQGGKK